MSERDSLKKSDRDIHVAIPAMAESGYLPDTLNCLQNQSVKPAVVWVCINHPEDYRDNSEKKQVVEDNLRTLIWLESNKRSFGFPIEFIDRCSPGKGWSGKRHGVGIARKTLMDKIAGKAQPLDIILSLDADTLFGESYLESVLNSFCNYPEAVGLANPYFHKLTGDDTLDRSMLRYEIYMRHYAINMWRIGSEYSFTALGSAIATPVWAYHKAGGMSPKKSGEDFYFLQKLCKMGSLLQYNSETVYPASRYSDRVFFGTGPALIRGSKGDWISYPIYDYTLFDLLGEQIALYPKLFREKHQHMVADFMNSLFREEDVFAPLRENNSEVDGFVKACHQKIDGLRLLQFLKTMQEARPGTNPRRLKACIEKYHGTFTLGFSEEDHKAWEELDFSQSSIPFLDKIRNLLVETEQNQRKPDKHEDKR